MGNAASIADLIAAAPELESNVEPLRPVRVAIVGLGRMGVAHAAVLSMLPGTTIVAAVDSQASAARRLRGLGFRFPVTTNLDDVLNRGVDAVWVCTPPDSHLALTRRCLAAGTAVFVEKPLAQSLAEARALQEVAGASSHPVGCGYTLAFWPSFVAARVLLQAGVVGTPSRAVTSMHVSRVFGPQRGWMFERARSGGGVVANLSSHLLYLLRWYFGMPESVSATWRQIHTTVEDEIRASLTMPGCPDVVFESSWCVPGLPISLTRLTIEGSHGTMTVDNDGLLLDLRQPKCGLPAGATKLADADLPQPARFLFNGEAYYLEDAHFLRWVTGGSAPPITAADGFAVQRIIDALYTSAAGGGGSVAVLE